MSFFAAARSALRTAAGRTSVGSRLSAGAGSKPAPSTFRIPKANQSRLSRPSFRSAEETCRCVGSLLPYHSATASAVLTSMLVVSRRSSCWTPEDD